MEKLRRLSRGLVLLLCVFVISTSVSSGSTSDHGGSVPTTPLAATPQPSGLRPWSEGGSQRVQTDLASPYCEALGRCDGGGGVEASAARRNCFCDELCSYYDDCCGDYIAPDGAGQRFAHLPRGVATCQRINDSETRLPVDVYMVSRCPKHFRDRQIRRMCEGDDGADRFRQLPVTGNTSLLLYRNIFCAVCAGERNPVFWVWKVRCGVGQQGLAKVTSGIRDPDDIRKLVLAGCPVDHAPVYDWAGKPGAPRRCRAHIGRCDREWTDEQVRDDCRQSTNYVYAKNRAFRNKHCALCNHVNETYLRCDDVRAHAPPADVTSAEETAAVVVTVDLNRGRAVVMETRTGNGADSQTSIELPVCEGAEGRVYDPLAGECREVTCAPGMEFAAGSCHPGPEAEEQNDQELDYRHDDVDDDVTGVKDNSTTASSSLSSPTSGAWSTAAMDTGTIATTDQPFEPMSARFVLFRMDSLQRLVSLIGTLFCILFLVVYIIFYHLFDALRSDGGDRCVVCYSVCLLIAHLLFIFIILPTEEFPGPVACFCISTVIQYAYMTSFFWLSVMSIDVFRRLTGDGQVAPPNCACFALFSLYAWLVPAVAMAGSTALAVLRVDGWDQLYDGPAKGCFVLGLSQLLIFVLPVALVVVTNVTMYVIMTCHVCLDPRPVTKADREGVQRTAKDRKRLATCIHLTVVMTTAWVMAFLAHVTRLSFLWYVFIVFDMLQGLSVCVAFLFKVKVWNLLNRRSLRITRKAEGHGRNTHQHSPDGVDCAIEPFIDTSQAEGDAQHNDSNSQLDTIMRETSI